MSNEKKYDVDSEDLACTILHGIEFKDEDSMICAIKEVANYIDKTDQQTALLQSRIKELEYELNLYKGSLKIPFKNYGDDGTSLSSDEITNLL